MTLHKDCKLNASYKDDKDISDLLLHTSMDQELIQLCYALDLSKKAAEDKGIKDVIINLDSEEEYDSRNTIKEETKVKECSATSSDDCTQKLKDRKHSARHKSRKEPDEDHLEISDYYKESILLLPILLLDQSDDNLTSLHSDLTKEKLKKRGEKFHFQQVKPILKTKHEIKNEINKPILGTFQQRFALKLSLFLVDKNLDSTMNQKIHNYCEYLKQ